MKNHNKLKNSIRVLKTSACSKPSLDNTARCVVTYTDADQVCRTGHCNPECHNLESIWEGTDEHLGANVHWPVPKDSQIICVSQAICGHRVLH